MAKKITEMTRKEFEALPYRGDFDTRVECRSIVILPLRGMHDSGYRLMDFVAVNDVTEPICRVSGCSDVLHIDGIGGYRFRREEGLTRSESWSIDCLPKSGLLHLFPDRGLKIIVGSALSSFEIVTVKE